MEEKEFAPESTGSAPQTEGTESSAMMHPRRRPRISESRFREAGAFDANQRPAYVRNDNSRMDYQRPMEGNYNRPAGGYQRDYQRNDRGDGYQPYQRPSRPNTSYRRYDNAESYQRPASQNYGTYQQPDYTAESSKDETGAQVSGNGYQPNYNRQPNYQPRGRYNNNGYNRQQGGYNRQQGNYNRSQNGYQRPQNGYQQDGYQRQGGYNRQQNGYNRFNNGGGQGGYNNRYNNGNHGNYGHQQGGFNRPQRRNTFNPHRPVEYTETIVDPNEEIRLNKYLANAGICSRREADEYIAKGAIKVNGEVVTELGTKVTRKDAILFNDRPVSLERKVYVLLNKPKDTVTTSDDPQGRQTVMDLVRNAAPERIYPVGRLDRNTTGVMLLTNDGDLASKLTHPKYIKKKIYHVWLDKDVNPEHLARIAAGVELEDGPIHADAIAYASETDKNQVGIEIHSGKNRIVRRIFEHLGYRVVKLDRVYFAGLTKKNVPRGRWRHLTQQEVNMLKQGAFE